MVKNVQKPCKTQSFPPNFCFTPIKLKILPTRYNFSHFFSFSFFFFRKNKTHRTFTSSTLCDYSSFLILKHLSVKKKVQKYMETWKKIKHYFYFLTKFLSILVLSSTFLFFFYIRLITRLWFVLSLCLARLFHEVTVVIQ